MPDSTKFLIRIYALIYKIGSQLYETEIDARRYK